MTIAVLAFFVAVPCVAQRAVKSTEAPSPRAATTTTATTTWLKNAPRLLWQRALGEGESGIAVAGRRLYTMFRRGDDEHVVAIDPVTGEFIWDHAYPAPLPDQLYTKHGRGPHAMPLVTQDRVISLGISGLLHCLAAADGKVLWSHDLMKEYGGVPPDCGYAATPIAYKDTVVVLVGGRDHSIVALGISDGRAKWHEGSSPIAYATPILVDVDGEDQLIAFMAEEVIGIDPTNGSLKWRYPHKTDHGVNASQPVWEDDQTLFVSSAYGMGTRALKLTRSDHKTSVTELWHQPKMQIHFGTLSRIGEYLYGTSGDFGPMFLAAVNRHTGELVWKKRNIAKKASSLVVDGRLLMLDEDGFLILTTVSSKGVTVNARHRLTTNKTWTIPTLWKTMLYIRDQESLRAFDLK